MNSDNIYEDPHRVPQHSLRQYVTTDSVLLPIPRDTFEKLYLNPKLPHKGSLHKTFGNPTPIALMGFVLSALPMSCIQMGWRGAGGNGGAILPVYIFFGGLVQILGAIGEWLIGNTFSSALFFTYGTFWLVNGTSEMPFFAVGVNYSPTGNNLEGQTTDMFYATVGFYYIFLGVLSFVYLICSIRTNMCLVLGLIILVVDVGMFCGVYFNLALGNYGLAGGLKVAAGALTMALCAPVGYLFIAQILEAVDFPISLPVGDLSTMILGKTQRARMAEQVNKPLRDFLPQ
ncbi:plasma membrane ammonium transporter [Talaromyces proteolyticus]|uniref:Plasma membrane ammonium transporter n=1 Tax=Talaromyces proteolyticus TaxID=1131652 RepID=A0AAD4KYM6_9EURO|nr:plasma membrane ammonium transporter [Talaromyces proteolyticus]KAH8703013.1 plasma membrane ammonium transporter [Talaromyces proteolyticus]